MKPKQKELIQIKTQDLEKLACRLVEMVQEKYNIHETVWLTEAEVMAVIGIRSKGALFRLRQQGVLRYSQPYKRVIMYDKKSAFEFMNKHVKEPFQ